MAGAPEADKRVKRVRHERNTLAFDATLGLGSNIGDKSANIETAVARLTSQRDIVLVRQSGLYRSPPWGVTEQDWFVNAAVAVATSLTPRALLERCQQVEHDMGRLRRERWGPRIIDIDILTYRDAQVKEPDLVIPHPLIGERAFVLVPLREIAPHVRVGSHSVDELAAAVDTHQITLMR